MFDEWTGIMAIVLAAAVLAVAVALTAQFWSTSTEVSKKLSLRVIADAVPYNGSWTLAIFNLGPTANITGVWTDKGFKPIGKVLERGEHLMLSVADQPYKVQACALPASPLSCELIDVAGWAVHIQTKKIAPTASVTLNASMMPLGPATVIINVSGCSITTLGCGYYVSGMISGVFWAWLSVGTYELIIPVLGQSIFEAGDCIPYYGYITYNNFTGSYVLYPGTTLNFNITTKCPESTTTTTTSGGGGGGSIGPSCVPSASISTDIFANPNGYAQVNVETCGASVEDIRWGVSISYDSYYDEWQASIWVDVELSNGKIATGNYFGPSACHKQIYYSARGVYSITIPCG